MRKGKRVISVAAIFELDYPILLVTHYEDDDSWAFLCGTTEDTRDGRVIGMGKALSLDQTLRSVADLQPGWSAWRESKDSEWVRYPETAA